MKKVKMKKRRRVTRMFNEFDLTISHMPSLRRHL
jgi:hypothetical protein